MDNQVQGLFALEGKVLGKGSFGTVYLGINIANEKYVALKKIPIEIMKDQEKVNALSNEILISAGVENENLVTIIDLTDINEDKYIVYEFCNGGDLRRYLRYFKFFDESFVQYFIKQILNGLSELHGKKIIHHDIKPENILVELVPENPDSLKNESDKKAFEQLVDEVLKKTDKKKNKNNNINNNNFYNNEEDNSFLKKDDILRILKRSKIKVSDFGLSKFKEDNNQKMLSGSPLYMDPTLFEPDVKIETIENEKVDIWAIGILAYELFTGKRPFNSPSQSLKELIQILQRGTYIIDLQECGKISKQFLSFLNMCLQRKQKTRPDVMELQLSEFVTREPNMFEYIDRNNIYSVKFPKPSYVIGDTQIMMNIDDQRSVNATFDF